MNVNMGIDKLLRFKSKANLSLIRSLPCFVCEERPCDPDHFKSRGAGGGDELSNLNALCRRHHCERHNLGIKTFWNLYHLKIQEARDKHDLPRLDLKGILD